LKQKLIEISILTEVMVTNMDGIPGTPVSRSKVQKNKCVHLGLKEKISMRRNYSVIHLFYYLIEIQKRCKVDRLYKNAD